MTLSCSMKKIWVFVPKTVSLLKSLVGNVLVHLAFTMYHNLRISGKLISQFLWWSVKLNTVGENRTGRSVAIAPGVWRHWITLAMRHQHQLLLPCLVASRGACFSCLGTQNVSPFSKPNKEHMWSKSWKAGSRPRACLHLCPGGLSDQSVGACGQWRFFLLGLSGIAFFAQWISVYNVNVTTIPL